MSLGYAFVMSILGPMWSTPAEIAGSRGAGFASGFVNFVGNVGGIGSPILMGVVFQRFHSFTPAILISAAITLVLRRAVPAALSGESGQAGGGGISGVLTAVAMGIFPEPLAAGRRSWALLTPARAVSGLR